MGRTIKQIAEDCGVSKTAIKKKITVLGLDDKLVRDGYAILVNGEEENIIRESYGLPPRRIKPTVHVSPAETANQTDNQSANLTDNQPQTDNQKAETANHDTTYIIKPTRPNKAVTNADKSTSGETANQTDNQSANQPQTDNQAETTKQLSMVIEMLRKELDNKQKELDTKNEQIRELTERLKASQELQKGSQALQANAEQKILALEAQHDEKLVEEEKSKKHWWTFWKK